MGKLILFALFTSPAWAVMLLALVTSHRRGARLELREAREAACSSCTKGPECVGDPGVAACDERRLVTAS